MVLFMVVSYEVFLVQCSFFVSVFVGGWGVNFNILMFVWLGVVVFFVVFFWGGGRDLT